MYPGFVTCNDAIQKILAFPIKTLLQLNAAFNSSVPVTSVLFGPRVVLVRRFTFGSDNSSPCLERDNSVADNSVLSFCTDVHRRAG